MVFPPSLAVQGGFHIKHKSKQSFRTKAMRQTSPTVEVMILSPTSQTLANAFCLILVFSSCSTIYLFYRASNFISWFWKQIQFFNLIVSTFLNTVKYLSCPFEPNQQLDNVSQYSQDPEVGTLNNSLGTISFYMSTDRITMQSSLLSLILIRLCLLVVIRCQFY